jgi:hypothetical protein
MFPWALLMVYHELDLHRSPLPAFNTSRLPPYLLWLLPERMVLVAANYFSK